MSHVRGEGYERDHRCSVVQGAREEGAPMKDSAIKACVGAICVTIAYAAYVCTTHADGVVFGSAIAAIAALAGYSIGATVDRKECRTVPPSEGAPHPDPEEPLLGVK